MDTKTPADSPPRLLRLQVLRAFAALAVVMYHLTVRSHELLGRSFFHHAFGFGAAGVDTFFVISGFIIYTVHQKDIGRPHRGRRYLLKRLIRIYPIYWLITILVLPVYLSGYGDATKRSLAVIVKSIVLFPQNPGVVPLVNVAWTLSYEMFFYLMFYLFIATSKKVAATVWVLWLVPCAVVLICELTHLRHIPQTLVFTFVFSPRNLEFVLGCGVAYVLSRRSLPVPRLIGAIGVVWFLAVGFTTSLVHGFRLFSGLPALEYGLPSGLIVAGFAAADTQLAKPLKRGVLVRLGDASYTLYLIHFSIVTGAFLFLRKIVTPPRVAFWAYDAVVIVVASAISIGIYELLERPTIRVLTAKLVPASSD